MYTFIDNREHRFNKEPAAEGLWFRALQRDSEKLQSRLQLADFTGVPQKAVGYSHRC